MHLETLANGQSFLHRLDPRAKLISAIALSIASTLGQGIITELIALIFSIIYSCWARLSWHILYKRLLPINIFIGLIWLTMPWHLEISDYPTLKIDPLKLTLAINITLKTNSIALFSLAFIATSSMNHLFNALIWLHTPKKLVYLFRFFYRYLYVLHREYYNLKLAVKARSFIPRTTFHTYRTYSWLLGILLIRSYNRAQRVYQAMLCRGFNNTYYLLDDFQWSNREILFLISVIPVFLTLVILELIGA